MLGIRTLFCKHDVPYDLCLSVLFLFLFVSVFALVVFNLCFRFFCFCLPVSYNFLRFVMFIESHLCIFGNLVNFLRIVIVV